MFVFKRMFGALLAAVMLFGCVLPVCAALAADTDMGTYWWGVTAHTLSAQDRDLVERVVAAEARGAEYDGMVGVAQVIRERAESWGMTAREVVLESAQFAPAYKGEISDDVRCAVADVFDNGVRVFAAYTTHFHHEDILPFWTKSKIRRAQIGTQVFWGIDLAPAQG